MKFFKYILLVVTLLVSVSASAWITVPTNQTDWDLKAYYTNLYAKPGTVLTISFFNESEHLAFILLDGGSTIKWRFHSNQLKIGYGNWTSTSPPADIKYILMCPDGRGTIVKRHIELTKSLFVPNKYDLRTDGTVCGSPPIQPPNQTSIDTIKALYPPEFTVTRLWSNRDLFSVRCYTSPSCDVWNSANQQSYPTQGVVYYSNTQKIGLRKFFHDPSTQWVAVRTKATVTNQTAKDDIDILTTNGVENQPWSWVDYNSDPAFNFWFN